MHTFGSMRRRGLAIAVLIGALTGPVRAGSADEPIDPDEQAEPRLPTVQLVQAWPKTKQALLYDPIQGTYVVVAAGQNVDGFRVSRIGKNQIVLSTMGGPARDYVLLPTPVADLPDSAGTPPKAPPAPTAPAPTTEPARPAAPDLIDPYPAGMLDPYGAEGVRVVDAPPQSKAAPGAPTPTPAPGPAPTATVTTGPVTKPPAPAPASGKPAPAIAKPATTRPAKPAAPTHSTPPPAPAIAKPAPAAPTPAAAPTPGTVVLDKKDLNDALADFATLTKDSRLTLGPTGVAFAHVAPGSLFARVGLRDGDRIVTINGSPIRSVDDAADLYAQLGGMKQLALDVVRGSGHVTLRADLR